MLSAGVCICVMCVCMHMSNEYPCVCMCVFCFIVGPLEQFIHSMEPQLRQLGLPTTLKKGSKLMQFSDVPFIHTFANLYRNRCITK